MPVLKNARHERFAQLVAGGMQTLKAHGEAGFKASTANATHLRQTPAVSARIEELLQERAMIQQEALQQAIDATGLDKGAVINMLLEDRKQAKELGQPSAAIRADELLGKELGMFRDRVEHSADGSIAALLKAIDGRTRGLPSGD